MNLKTIVQFHSKEVDVTDLETTVKAVLKENKIALKNVDEAEVYVKPEAKYLVVKVNGEVKEFTIK